jgi:hypothetical protein
MKIYWKFNLHLCQEQLRASFGTTHVIHCIITNFACLSGNKFSNWCPSSRRVFKSIKVIFHHCFNIHELHLLIKIFIGRIFTLILQLCFFINKMRTRDPHHELLKWKPLNTDLILYSIIVVTFIKKKKKNFSKKVKS